MHVVQAGCYAGYAMLHVCCRLLVPALHAAIRSGQDDERRCQDVCCIQMTYCM
jgi:hypothetical protein